MPTLSQALEAYLLANDLDPNTERWYRRVVGVFRHWHGSDPPCVSIDAETLSRFLRDKQRSGRASHYVKSLRSGMLALLGDAVDPRKVRTVRLTKLRPATWTQPQVEFLVSRVSVLPAYKRTYYSRVTLHAWYSGLSRNDLHLIERRHFQADGTLLFERHKTGEEIVAWVPPELLDGLPAFGPLFPRLWSDEQFRKDFKRMVLAAGLVGTFKTLRKTSGTEAEIAAPGRGHEHLANSRKVFETHYLDRNRVHREPVKLPHIRLGG